MQVYHNPRRCDSSHYYLYIAMVSLLCVGTSIQMSHFVQVHKSLCYTPGMKTLKKILLSFGVLACLLSFAASLVVIAVLVTWQPKFGSILLPKKSSVVSHEDVPFMHVLPILAANLSWQRDQPFFLAKYNYEWISGRIEELRKALRPI